MWVAFAVVALGGIALVLAGWFGLTGKLPPNAWAGIRTPYSMSSPERWYAVHRAASPIIVFAGVAVVSGALAFLPFVALGRVPDGVAAVALLSLAFLMFASAILSWWVGTSAAKRQLG